MNKAQKIALLIGIIVIILMSIYPPLGTYSKKTGKKIRCSRYVFFTNISQFSINRMNQTSFTNIYFDVDYTRLGVQWLVAAVATGGFLVVFKDYKKE